MPTRRELIAGAVAAAAIPSIAASSRAAAAADSVDRAVALTNALSRSDSLAFHAAKHGILFGTCADPKAFDKDPKYGRAVARECSLLVPESVLKPVETRPTPTSFDFTKSDRLADFATKNGMAMRGHCLVWYQTVPAWVMSGPNACTTRESALAEMTLEVTTPVSHFAGRLDSWDVVNEIIDVHAPNNLKQSFWLDMIGPDYIPLAFHAARKADPNVTLVLNENHLEGNLRYNETKRTAVLDLLRSMKSANVPVDALGIQAHLGTKEPLNPDLFARFLDNVHDLGLKILITELDVADQALPADVEERDAAVAKILADFLAISLAHPGVITVNFWGLSARHTWLTHFAPRPDGLNVRPTVLDGDLARTPAYFAVETAFDHGLST